MPEQRIVRFFGRVQGVGFRYAACRTAEQFAVTGYVRNLSDGSVECVLEGERAELDAFVDAISELMEDHIDRRQQQTAPATGQFRSFDVKY